jgi:hypothetical protein
MTPEAWSVVARNLPEHAGNPIHTDAGARAAGFPRALVAGVTTYAYLTHPIVAAWGLDWVAGGGGAVRFGSPVMDGDALECVPRPGGDDDPPGAVIVEARHGSPDGDVRDVRAVLTATPTGAPSAELRQGERLEPIEIELSGAWTDEYGARTGDDLTLYREHQVVHPAVWPALANKIVGRNLVRGSWIHTRSVISHHGLGAVGAVATIEAVVVRRFERRGERAVVDVRISAAGACVATLEHEAIVALPGA